MTPKSRRLGASLLVLSLGLAGCAVGPDYERPAAAQPAAFKENAGWTPAEPADHIDRGAWWSVYADPTLDGLMRKVEISNQNLAAAEANYRQARALTSEARAALFPTISASAGATRSGGSGQNNNFGSGTVTGATRGAQTRYTASIGASWAPDIWGRIRRNVEASRANGQASAADLASAKLSYQADLAANYFALRALDEQARLFARNIEGYQRTVQLTNNQYSAGVAARADVITAETQLKNTQAQAADLGVQRAQLEHAIAVLIGLAPSDLTLGSEAGLATAVPVAPAGLPSTLLQRRPDIAAAERSVAAANAQIGVATAAFFPNLTLSGSEGFNATSLGSLFSAGSNVWSFGPALAETVFDFGARKARVAQARAGYDREVALYRQTVLVALQSVEDQLAALRVLENEATLRNDAMASARQAEALALNRYRAGQVDFTTVVQAQTTAVAAEQSALSVQRQRLLASVSLIEALGGGWSIDDLPKG